MKTNDSSSYKIVLVGQSGVGKSTLMLSFINEETPTNLKPTVGLQFTSKKLSVSEDKSIILNIWDTAGSEKYRSIVKNFYRGSSAVIIVYSITNEASFEKLGFWYNQAKQNSNKNSVIMVIGTHLDKQDDRQVSKVKLYEWASQNEIDLIQEVCAVDLKQVNKLFKHLAQKIHLDKLLRKVQYQKAQNKKSFASMSIYAGEEQEQKKRCCV